MTLFDRSKLTLQPVQNRKSLMTVDDILPLDYQSNYQSESLTQLAEEISQSDNVIVAIGGHVIRAGVQRYLSSFILRGVIGHLAMNGAGLIHDFDLATCGHTTEDVQHYLDKGQFGLWSNLEILNTIVEGAEFLGEHVGKWLWDTQPTFEHFSLCARMSDVTIHIGVGYDIVCELPNYNGAAWGSASYNDFLKFVNAVSRGGVYLNIGTAVMGPEIFLKALAMVRNAGYEAKFVTGVFDIVNIPNPSELPKKDDSLYYFRPYKTVLHRAAERSYYVQGRHRDTIPALWRLLTQ